MQVRWRTTSILTLFLIKCGLAVKNSVLDVSSVCNQDTVNVTIEFENVFTGVVHSRGSECPLTKDLSNKPYGRIITISLDPTACSLRITKENGVLWYGGTLLVQMSETVQQATDPEVQVKCSIGTDMLMMKTRLKRTGRKMSTTDRNETGKAWLEVRGSAISTFSPSNSLSVGEHTTLSVYTSLPEGISGLPVECRVDDGHGGTQSLTDDRGCPTDPALVPRLRQAAPGHWATAFPAFSFPDTHIVHYTCLLMLCSGPCPKFDCNEESNSTRNSRDFQEESILDFVELYNSVEVNAPNIELGYLRKDTTENQGVPSGITEDGWVCLSGPRVALVFATLGALFLAAVLATLLLLIRHRRKHHYRHHQHHYGIYT